MRPALHAALLLAAAASAQAPNPAVYTFTVAGVGPGVASDGAYLNGTWTLRKEADGAYRTGPAPGPLPAPGPVTVLLLTEDQAQKAGVARPRPSVRDLGVGAFQRRSERIGPGNVAFWELSLGPLHYVTTANWDGAAPLTLTRGFLDYDPAKGVYVRDSTPPAVTGYPPTLTVTRVP